MTTKKTVLKDLKRSKTRPYLPDPGREKIFVGGSGTANPNPNPFLFLLVVLLFFLTPFGGAALFSSHFGWC